MLRIRRLIIKTAEVLMIVLVAITILLFAISGAIFFSGAGPDQPTRTFLVVLGLALGGFFGLVISAVVASVFFLILEIAENSRRMLSYYEPDTSAQRR